MKNLNNTLPSIFMLVTGFLLSDNVYSYKIGISGFSKPESYCIACHNTGTVPTVSLTGPASVVPGQSARYTFTISGGQQNSGGLNVSASGGNFINLPTSLKILNGELTHTQPATSVTGNISWSFDWQAPINPGTYTIYAAGVSANGDNTAAGDHAATASRVITTSGSTPIAIISAPKSAAVGTISFDGSKSAAPNGTTIIQYDWKVNNANFPNAGVNFSHNFTTADNVIITLTVIDSTNASGTTFTDIDIGGTLYPETKHTGPYKGTIGQDINFDASTTTNDPSTTITKYFWDFGDGNMLIQGNNATPIHAYTTAGNYTVTIAAQDGNGYTGVTSTTVTVTAPITGESNYNEKCASCHGTAGNGASAQNIIGATQNMILSAISTVQAMQAISITNTNVQLIADYLGEGGSTGQDFYVKKCAICHGADVTGGSGNFAGPRIHGATSFMIVDYITKVTAMNGIKFNSNTDIQLLADYLGLGGRNGSEYYTNKCEICHATNGAGGGAYNGPDIRGKKGPYQSDIDKVKEMNSILLSPTEDTEISNFLLSQ